MPHQSFNHVRDEASGGAWPRLGEIITSGENIEIRFFFTLMKSDFQGGPPDEHHFLLKVPKVTVGIFISSSPGTSRAGGNPNSLSINLLHAVLFPYLLIPPSLLTDEYFIAWTRDEHSPVSFTSPGKSSRSRRHWSSTRWERWTWELLAIEIFYEVCILCFDVCFQVVHMADYLSRRSSSATLPSPSPLTPFHPIVPREVHIGVKFIWCNSSYDHCQVYLM